MMSASVEAIPLTQNQPTSSIDLVPPHPSQPSNIAPEHMYKNKLQEYAQKSAIPLPVYETVNEGAPHAPKFRSRVLVDGSGYMSSTTFTHRKAAEQDAARVALTAIPQKIKNVACPLIRQDTTFCKSILNEYASKKRLEKPIYNTIQPGGLLPVFVSSVVFNGVTYAGDTGRNKKEAEQLAARAAILAILDSANGEDIYEIIQSKIKLYAAINGSKETANSSYDVPVMNAEAFNLNKRKYDGVTAADFHLPCSEISHSTLIVPSINQAATGSFHDFKKPKPSDDLTALALITFVPASLPQPVLPSTSGVKQSRRKKKKSKKGMQINNQTPSAMVPVHQIPPCPVSE